VSVLGAPWHVNADADFADACNKCENMVYLSKETHKQVLRCIVLMTRENMAIEEGVYQLTSQG
jgi:hypothetical protein